MQKETRWYDKNQGLKNILNFLENAPQEIRINVAIDIIQFITQENFASINELAEFSKTNYIGQANRWYDADYTVHSAIEMLKLLTEQELYIVINEIASSIVFFTQYQQKDLTNNLKINKIT